MDESLSSLHHFDIEKLKSRMGNNEAVYEKFVTLLQTTLHGQVSNMLIEIKEAIASENLNQLHLVAHRIKGIALSSSFQRLAHLTSTLEHTTHINKEYLDQILNDIIAEVTLLKTLVA